MAAGTDTRTSIREYLEGRGYAHHDATHAEAWELSGPGGEPVLRVIFFPRVTRVYAGIDWRDEFDVDRPPGPVVAYLEAAERELGLAPAQAALESREAVVGAVLETIREQARRFLRAVHGPDLVYRAPETFTGPDRWAWAVANDQAPMAETAIAGIEQACAQRSEGSSRG
jgi:hypothetical protein